MKFWPRHTPVKLKDCKAGSLVRLFSDDQPFAFVGTYGGQPTLVVLSSVRDQDGNKHGKVEWWRGKPLPEDVILIEEEPLLLITGDEFSISSSEDEREVSPEEEDESIFFAIEFLPIPPDMPGAYVVVGGKKERRCLNVEDPTVFGAQKHIMWFDLETGEIIDRNTDLPFLSHGGWQLKLRTPTSGYHTIFKFSASPIIRPSGTSMKHFQDKGDDT